MNKPDKQSLIYFFNTLFMDTSKRNWQKARLAGFCLDRTLLTETEKYKYAIILEYKESLLKNWDGNTEVLIGHDLPPYKCYWCGRRGTRQYLVEGINFCYRHSKSATITT